MGYIEVPGRPLDEESDLYAQVETSMAIHHRVMCDAIQRTMEKRYGRLMIFAPPGSSKYRCAYVGYGEVAGEAIHHLWAQLRHRHHAVEKGSLHLQNHTVSDTIRRLHSC